MVQYREWYHKKPHEFTFYFSRCYAGLFSTPKFQFSGKLYKPAESDGGVQTDMLLAGDLLTDRVNVWGTSYKVGDIVVSDVICNDIIEIGVIEKIVVSGMLVKFLVSLYKCARDPYNIFQALPMNKAKLLSYDCLQDFKPLFKRGEGESFRFLLHHYLPCRNILT
jgi:hypothetical protein